MSKEKKFSDDLNDMLGDAKKGAEKLGNEAKESAKEFSQSAKETFNPDSENKKILAGVLAILLGVFGVHKFVLGYTKEGIIILVITVLLGAFTCGTAGWLMSILGLIEGIIYLTKSDEEFYATYQLGRRPWF